MQGNAKPSLSEYFMRHFFLFIALTFLCVPNFAHIGSPDIVYEGNAGPYKIHATIQPPDVVPGTAKIAVQIEEKGTMKVFLQPVYYQYGSGGAPKADRAETIQGTDNYFEGELWLMAFGSASVRITVEGGKGIGSTVVPVSALATATRKMDKVIEWILIPLGILLFAGLVTIIGVSTGQATQEPGKELSSSQKRYSMRVMFVFSFFLAGGLYLAKGWWDKVEAEYREFMYKPLYMQTELNMSDKEPDLIVHLRNRPWLSRNLSDLIPDHGKLMHLFLIGNDARSFSHLHPAQLDSSTYQTRLPSLETGTYFLVADIVHENGLSETLTDSLLISHPLSSSKLLDPDDSWAIFPNNTSSISRKKNLSISFDSQDSLRSKRYTKLRFTLEDTLGNPLLPEPYLGMAGHAVVMKNDHSVFIHLHPMGTVSMASQNALAGKVTGNVTLCNPLADSLFAASDTLVGLADAGQVSLMRNQKSKKNASKNGTVTFPYSFPSSGDYTIWVQIKKDRAIHTEKFNVHVL